MFRSRFLAGMLPAGTILIEGAGAVTGQDYPHKPICIITGSAGGGNDITSRDIAQGIADPLGQSVSVENRRQAVAFQAGADCPAYSPLTLVSPQGLPIA